MEWIFPVTSVSLYALLAFQDFKDREFYLLIIPLVIASNVVMAFQNTDSDTLMSLMKLNGLFVGILFTVLYFIYSLKEGSFSFPQSKIGWGDVLIIITIIPLFVPTLFRIVFLSVALSGLLLGAMYRMIRKDEEIKIPLAGLIASVCSVLIVLDSFQFIDLYNEPIL